MSSTRLPPISKLAQKLSKSNRGSKASNKIELKLPTNLTQKRGSKEVTLDPTKLDELSHCFDTKIPHLKAHPANQKTSGAEHSIPLGKCSNLMTIKASDKAEVAAILNSSTSKKFTRNEHENLRKEAQGQLSMWAGKAAQKLARTTLTPLGGFQDQANKKTPETPYASSTFPGISKENKTTESTPIYSGNTLSLPVQIEDGASKEMPTRQWLPTPPQSGPSPSEDTDSMSDASALEAIDRLDNEGGMQPTPARSHDSKKNEITNRLAGKPNQDNIAEIDNSNNSQVKRQSVTNTALSSALSPTRKTKTSHPGNYHAESPTNFHKRRLTFRTRVQSINLGLERVIADRREREIEMDMGSLYDHLADDTGYTLRSEKPISKHNIKNVKAKVEPKKTLPPNARRVEKTSNKKRPTQVIRDSATRRIIDVIYA